MEQGRMYKKYLSNLPPFQEAAVPEYALDFRGALTRFSLRLERGNLQQQTALCVQGLPGAQAHSLLLYLYENPVPAENWEDVAEELLSQLRMAPALPRSVPLRQWKEEKPDEGNNSHLCGDAGLAAT